MVLSRVPPSTAPEVTVTLRERRFIDRVADYPEDQWTDELLLEAARSVGFTSTAGRIAIQEPNLIMAAQRRRKGQPIVLKSAKNSGSTTRGNGMYRPADPDFNRPPDEPLWSDQMERFCHEVVSDIEGNVCKAALRAGYSNYEYGWKLIQKPKIKARIAYLKEDRAKRFKADADDVIRKLVILSNVNIIDFVKSISNSGTINFENSDDISRDKLYGLRKINKTVTTIAGRGGEERTIEKLNLETADPLKALKLLMDHLGLANTQGRVTDPEEYVRELRQFAEAVSDGVPGGEI